MPAAAHTFLRFSPPDGETLQAEIERERKRLQEVQARNDPVPLLDSAGNLGAMLTTQRNEAEAYALMLPLLTMAQAHAGAEPAAWFFHALATAAQYAGHREQALSWFDQALALARAHGWQRLEHFVLHHRGRCLAEVDRFDDARTCFRASLALRQALSDARQASSRQALDLLDEWQARSRAGGHASPLPP